MMMEKSGHLLKRLEPSIRPAYAGEGTRRPQAPLESRSFDQLLALVSDGTVRSDRSLTLEFEPQDELTEEQMARLASAADVAEASGSTRALLLIDGRGMVLDVSQRQLQAELSEDHTSQLAKIDSAVYVADGEETEMLSLNRLPGGGLLPPVVAEQIEQAYRAQNLQENMNHEPEDPRIRHAG